MDEFDLWARLLAAADLYQRNHGKERHWWLAWTEICIQYGEWAAEKKKREIWSTAPLAMQKRLY